jgi:predicted AAA+ superfamily ATPase
MEEYNIQFNLAKNMAEDAVNNNNNIIIVGPGYTGKTYIRHQLKELLIEQHYDIYLGVQEYMNRNGAHGRHYNINKFWIEENNPDVIQNVIEDYQYINCNLTYPS